MLTSDFMQFMSSSGNKLLIIGHIFIAYFLLYCTTVTSMTKLQTWLQLLAKIDIINDVLFREVLHLQYHLFNAKWNDKQSCNANPQDITYS